MSSTSINLAFVTKAAVSRFIDAKLESVELEDTKSVKSNVTDQ